MEKKSTKCIMTPIFSSPEQEKLFSRCAKASMSLNARLNWNNNDNVSGKVILSSPFSSEEQEDFFAQCAKDSMSTEARLSWQINTLKK